MVNVCGVKLPWVVALLRVWNLFLWLSVFRWTRLWCWILLLEHVDGTPSRLSCSQATPREVNLVTWPLLLGSKSIFWKLAKMASFERTNALFALCEGVIHETWDYCLLDDTVEKVETTFGNFRFRNARPPNLVFYQSVQVVWISLFGSIWLK